MSGWVSSIFPSKAMGSGTVHCAGNRLTGGGGGGCYCCWARRTTAEAATRIIDSIDSVPGRIEPWMCFFFSWGRFSMNANRSFHPKAASSAAARLLLKEEAKTPFPRRRCHFKSIIRRRSVIGCAPSPGCCCGIWGYGLFLSRLPIASH